MDFSTIDELYGNDSAKSLNGVPINIGLNRNNEPIMLYVAEAGNPNHLKATRKYERALESSRHNHTKRRLINAKIIAESLLMDWSGIIDTNGAPVPASVENKIEALVRSNKLMGDVIDAASDRSNFMADEPDGEDSEGN